MTPNIGFSSDKVDVSSDITVGVMLFHHKALLGQRSFKTNSPLLPLPQERPGDRPGQSGDLDEPALDPVRSASRAGRSRHRPSNSRDGMENARRRRSFLFRSRRAGAVRPRRGTGRTGKEMLRHAALWRHRGIHEKSCLFIFDQQDISCVPRLASVSPADTRRRQRDSRSRIPPPALPAPSRTTTARYATRPVQQDGRTAGRLSYGPLGGDACQRGVNASVVPV